MRNVKALAVATMFGAASLVGAPDAEAQVFDLHLGVKGGVNQASVIGQPTGLERRTGVNVGVFTDLRFFGDLTLEPGIYYAQKGYQSGANAQSPLPGGDVRVDYIDVPLMVKYVLPSDFDFRPSVSAGPYVGFKVGEHFRDVAVEQDQFRNTDYGLALGVGAEVGPILLDARYATSFADVVRDEVVNGTLDGAVRNSTITLMAGFMLPVTRR